VAWNPDDKTLVLLHGEGGWLTDPAPGYEFDLGLNTGPRAFGVHSFTGNRAFFTSVEVRRLFLPRVFNVMQFGLAAYGDYGGAWWSGSPERTGTDVGLGLRIGQTRAPQTVLTRIDLSWRFANDAVDSGWIVSIGRGFVFTLAAQRPRR
jgi:hemolysin activation/secretion protein